MASGFMTRAEVRAGAIGSLLLQAAQDDGGHSLVWSLFQHKERGDRCFLYREEAPGRFLVVSETPPSDDTGVWTLRTKPYEPELAVGDQLSFALRVNPAVTYRQDGRTRRADVVMKARHPLASGDDRQAVDREVVVREWLSPRLGNHGASLDHCALMAYTVRKNRARTGQRHQVAVADLEGTLTVTKPEAFTPLLFGGIGKARAYGCGLILVRRI